MSLLGIPCSSLDMFQVSGALPLQLRSFASFVQFADGTLVDMASAIVCDVGYNLWELSG